MERSRAVMAPLLAVALIAVVAPPGEAQEAPVVVWIRQFGTIESDVVADVAVDDAGVYLAGSTWGAFPGYSTDGFRDGFLMKTDLDGGEQWRQQSELPGVDSASGVASDGTRVYVIGSHLDPSLGRDVAVLSVHDSSGSLVWERRFGVGDWNLGSVVAVDATGLYIGGVFQHPDTRDVDVYVRALDSAGNVLWNHEFGDPASGEFSHGLAVAEGFAYAVGRTRGTLPGQVSAGRSDAYIQTYGPDGAVAWTRQFGSPEDDGASAVAAVRSNAYVAGFTAGALGDQTFAGMADAFVRKYDASGNVLWTRQFGTTGFDRATSLVADATGVYVAGWADGALPGQTLGEGTAFVRRFDASGNELWTFQFRPLGGEGGIDGMSVGRDALFVVGPVGIHAGQLPDDAYVARLRVPGLGAASCPASQGFWKNHPDVWPTDTLTLGSVTYGRAELLALLRKPPRGDASLILAHQLIASKLNVANGSDTVPIAATLSQADALLSWYSGKLPYRVQPSTSEGRAMTAAAEVLDAYNRRELTPDCGATTDSAPAPPSPGADDFSARLKPKARTPR